jgi:hypothetical protein
MYFILAKDKTYRIILLFSVLVIIAALFLSRGHYSIDVLSGVFFAFAIKAYGDKYLLPIFTKFESTYSSKKLNDNKE